MKSHEHVSQKTALVVGATGIIGRAITTALAVNGEWRVIALARSGASVAGAAQALSVDLLDREKRSLT